VRHHKRHHQQYQAGVVIIPAVLRNLLEKTLFVILV
jgi:hypothetical protein